MPYGTGSVATYLQRIGRGLRVHGTKTHCDIYIGGADPKIEKEKWDKVQRKAVNAGMRYDNAELDWEMNKELMSDKERTITKETIALSKKIRKRGMEELAEQVMNRQFPPEYLEHLVDITPSARCHKKAKMTAGQAAFLNERGIDCMNMTRNEAGTTIAAIAKSEGLPELSAIVPEGQHAGKPARTVPYSYINLVSKPSSKYYNSTLCEFFRDNR